MDHHRHAPTNLRADAPFHLFVALYTLAALLLSHALGVPHKFAPLMYLSVLAGHQMVTSVVVMGGLWSIGSPAPFATLRSALKQLASPDSLSGLLLLTSMCLFVGAFTSVKTMLPDLVPFFADPLLADIDRMLHGGRDPWRYIVELIPPTLTPVLESLYFGGWNLFLPGCMLAALFVPGLRKLRDQYIWSFLASWVLLGNLLAGSLMSAGPVYYQRVTGDARFADLVAYLTHHSLAQPFWQSALWGSYASGTAGLGSGISAFPSMHLANATLFVLLASRIGRRWMWGAAFFCGIILLSSVALGWHYALDGYVSIVATLLIWHLVGAVQIRVSRTAPLMAEQRNSTTGRVVTARSRKSVLFETATMARRLEPSGQPHTCPNSRRLDQPVRNPCQNSLRKKKDRQTKSPPHVGPH
jgi:hypothetical protein